MFISKKDLLKKYKISNSQLYRWKREGLIPEEWFIKQSGISGRNVYFPEAKIIKRIKTINKLKKKYTLEALSKILSNDMTDWIFSEDDLNIIEEIDKSLIPVFSSVLNKNNFTFIEVILMVALSSLDENISRQTVNIIEGIKDYIPKINSTRYKLVVLDVEGKCYAVLCAELAGIFPDRRLNVVQRIQLSEISNMVKIKYNRIFNFKNEKEELPF